VLLQDEKGRAPYQAPVQQAQAPYVQPLSHAIMQAAATYERVERLKSRNFRDSLLLFSMCLSVSLGITLAILLVKR
jgi:hypothetical protein